MSSNIRIVRICEFCKQEFIAKTTVTQCCSDDCAKRLYKRKKRDEKIVQANLKTEIKHKPKAFITEDQIKLINAKAILTLKEAATLLNISELTMRRWVLSGKVKSQKAGKRHLILRTSLPVKGL
jgi:excisionase family DNA binding protein